MGDKVMDKVFEYIDALAAKLGVASEYVFKVLIRQEIISSIVHIFGFLVVIIALFIWIKFAYKKFSNEFEENKGAAYLDRVLIWTPVFWISAVLSAIASIGLFLNIVDLANHLANPEYYAIKQILNTVSGK